jgi:hypothetical protein
MVLYEFDGCKIARFWKIWFVFFLHFIWTKMTFYSWADGKLEDSERTLLMVYAERYGIEESYSTKVVDFLLNEAKSGVSNEQMMSDFNKL